MSLTVEVVGLDQFEAQLARLSSALPSIGSDALKDELDGVLVASQEIVPVDTGRLKASGFVDDPASSGGQVVVAIGYDTPYATKVHEDLSMRHPHGGQAKFLEQPLHQWSDVGPERVVKKIVDGVGR